MRSSSHVYPVMASQTKVACSFSSTGDYLAYSGFDGVLKIWETATGNSVADFSPSQHLTATCTCLQWGPGRHFQSVSVSLLQVQTANERRIKLKLDPELEGCLSFPSP